MKNLVKSIILFMGASILFTACGPNSALTKRHYRKGYHFDYAKKANSTKLKTNNEFINQPVSIAQEKVESVSQKNIFANVPEPKMDERNVNSSITNQKAANPTNKFYKLQLNPLLVKETVIINYVENKREFKKLPQATRNDDARSFFWTLILILLILWLIGVLAGGWGLGGLIHLILVIALILFILWLFRII